MTGQRVCVRNSERQADRDGMSETEGERSVFLTFAVLAISIVTSLADALEGLWSVLAESVDVTVICGFGALISICGVITWDKI